KKLNSISGFTLSTIYELRDTIWAMNKSEITFEDLKVRISNFIEKANLSAHNTLFNFEVEKNLENEKAFTSVEGMNIYRIIQEAVNNAIKYANAKHINVAFLKSLDNMDISVKDDGIGFDIDNTEFGNGLNNIQKRAKDLNANVEFISSPTSGTEILVKKPI
ncbi:MAG: ATP-binding protein, partial [Flavobacteriaceae bacterium]